MASSSKFSVRAFVIGSQRLNQEKAEINDALVFLRRSFNNLRKSGPETSFELEDEQNNKLLFAVAPKGRGLGNDQDDIENMFEIRFFRGDGTANSSLMSSTGIREPIAQSLSDQDVGPCRALVERLWDRMTGLCDLSQGLDVYYEAAARAAADDAERNQ